MNSYSLAYSGSWLIIILALLVALIITYFYYKRTVPELSKSRKVLLFSMRTVALALLIFIIFEPIFTTISGKFIEPKIAVLLDNSASMSIDYQNHNRKEIYRKAIDDLNLNKYSDRLKTVSFDKGFRMLYNPAFDSLTLNGNFTNIANSLKLLSAEFREENVRAVLLLSDGVFNSGGNPIYEAEVLGMPVYTLGIGDTIRPKDIAVKSVNLNPTIQLNTTHLVNVGLSVSGFDSGKVTVEMFDNNTKFAEKTLSIDPRMSDYSLTFEYTGKQEGIRRIKAIAKRLENEITYKNNELSEFTKVTSEKKNIIVLAGAPSPDLSFILNILRKNENLEVKSFVQKKDAEFYDNPPVKSDFANANSIILIGLPIKSTPIQLMENIKNELDRKKSLMIIGSQNLDYSKLRTIDNYLPFSLLSSKEKEYNAIANFTEKSLENPLLKSTDNLSLNNWNELPPIFRTETFVKPKPHAEILAKVKVNNTELNEPMIIFGDRAGNRTLAILGYGIYRWKLMGYARDVFKSQTDAPDLLDIFISNSSKWLIIDDKEKNVVIRPVSKSFIKGDRVEFFAQVSDKALNPVDNAAVNVTITDGSGKNYNINMFPSGSGFYKGYANGLPEGDFYYTGKASKNGTILGEDKGRFIIGDTPLEYMELMMNKQLLQEMASRTGGSFYYNQPEDNLIESILSSLKNKQNAVTLRSEINLWNLPLIMGIIILLFALEWFLRKRYGLI